MPKVVIFYDNQVEEYFVHPVPKTREVDPDWETVVDMKASHYKNIRRNQARYQNDQDFLQKFFIEAQMAGREIRER